MSGISYYNSERYPDPTAYAGLISLWCIYARLTRITSS